VNNQPAQTHQVSFNPS